MKKQVKQWTCPDCKQTGTFNNHGSLENKAGEVRGIRFWCSLRRKSQPGCGKSYSVWLKNIVPGHSVAAQVLGCFLIAWSELKGDVLAAWQRAKTGFSTDSAYRWARRFRLNQGEIRTRLTRVRAPPRPLRESTHADLFEHLSVVLGSNPIIETFQMRFQQPWPMAA